MTQTAIITGAAGGIGKELARRLAARNINLVLVDLKEEAVQAVIAELGLNDSNSLVVAADVSKEEDVQNYVNKAVEKFGTIDYFANNAGIEGPLGNVEDLGVSALDLVYNVNVRGVFLGMHYVVPVMKKQKSGAILNTSSLAGLMGAPGMSPYVMSKHAVIGLTRVVANELAPLGIRVNAVLPGTINTRMMRQIEQNSGSADAFKKANEAATPMGRYGEPEEVAAVMNFLLSEDASFVTASLYTVDGGMVAQ
ncbi:NAD(P)-dependent dehydrogenase (short-subunit alcohol dehydrogenase family) [Paenibacillus phyllosphaerae]|uniref:NAD(P)-dependent dehydrogenase (Short-subunit alcohol dehydrogenase family) n=1 Tax=Paenibacillus phyllosphaerae TaxID=274593 RepID=A0A7W5B5X0_9BACL|nr:SDR family NAD(P)-dependent oxidoreductase [Paenibacillus phyllosphaerae]MBB3114759.1 NAD(P)-dependent dehydrogenase (short-subunit alcohol dehydrogenase family) [Paenibacillus phyllosphaerae]